MIWCVGCLLLYIPCLISSKHVNEKQYSACDVEDLEEYVIKQRLVPSSNYIENCNVKLSINGTKGNIIDILLCGGDGHFNSIIKHVDFDIGDIKYIILDKGNDENYNLMEIEISKGNRFWLFNCNDQFEDGKAKIYPQGNKPYVIELKTGFQIGAGTSGNINIKLVGDSGQSGFIYLANHLNRASVNIFHVKTSEVGELKSIVLSNDSEESPWYCISVSVVSNGYKVVFDVNRWIGGTYNTKAFVTLNDKTFAEEIACSTRLVDIFPGIPTHGLHTLSVKCPMNCPKENVEGFVVHPNNSLICSAAISDGIISYGGGEVNITVGPQIPRYYASATAHESLDYEPFKPTSSFYLYKIDSIDDIDSKIRLVDGRGELSSIGRFEVYDENSGNWATVCASGKNTKFTSKAAQLICHNLGFETGEKVYTGCKDVYGDYMCAGKGYPVAIAGLGCLGTEKSISQCPFEKPTLDCMKHEDDVVIHCRKHLSSFADVRLVDYDGRVANNGGLGRLEINVGGFHPICKDNWSIKEATVACNQLGFASIDGDGCVDCYCEQVKGKNYCSKQFEEAPIKVTCNGFERSLTECKIEEAPEYGCNGQVVLSCAERELSKMNVQSLHFRSKPYKPLLKLSCFDTANDIEFDRDSIRVVNCPSGCKHTKTLVEGSLVYSSNSSICKAALHAGVIEDGGDVVVKLFKGFKRIFGTNMNDILSVEGVEVDKVFTVASVSPKLIDKLEQEEDLAGDNVQGEDEIASVGETKPAVFALKSHTLTGSHGSWINITNYDFWSQLISLNIFSISMHVKPVNQNRMTILSLGGCGGLVLSIFDNQLILEQICNSSYSFTLSLESASTSNLTNIDDEIMHILLTYYGPSKTIALYYNGTNILHKSNWSRISLQGPKYVGRLGNMDGEYFVGEIYGIEFYDHVLSSFDAKQAIKNFNSAFGPLTPHTDGKTHCLKRKDTTRYITNYAHNALSLECSDDLSVINGFVGETFSLFCPNDCSDLKWPLKGSGIYSPDSSICKAALHAGAGDHILLRIVDGLVAYKSTRGKKGIISCSDDLPQLMSFSVSPNISQEYLTCEDDAMWILKLALGSKHVVMCPNNCIHSKAKVYGTDYYTPNSSVCRAALHSKDVKGNRVLIEVTEGLDDYKGTERNGILSFPSKKYLRSFKVVNVDKCQ